MQPFAHGRVRVRVCMRNFYTDLQEPMKVLCYHCDSYLYKRPFLSLVFYTYKSSASLVIDGGNFISLI